MKDNPWLLPAGIDELLPAEARQLEALRRQLVDLYESWGYELVVPPLIEYLESLLTGTGSELDLQTFKLTDQLTGRMMGIRADMTPQVARIDARRLQRQVPSRLCYFGTVAHTRPDGFAGSRCPMQVGAELYGHSGPESDAEVLCLMLETLKVAGVDNMYIDLGHVGIYRRLAELAGLTGDQEAQLFSMLQRKALPEMHDYLNSLKLKAEHQEMLSMLATLNGDTDVLARAYTGLKAAGPDVLDAISYIEKVAILVNRRLPEVGLHYDLAELRGYHYQTGIVFAAFIPGQGQEIGRGGRYDDIGQVFGRPRPATGFSTDLRSLAKLSAKQLAQRPAILVPLAVMDIDEAELFKFVTSLRAQGERVIYELPADVQQQQDETLTELVCDRVLTRSHGQWSVEKIIS